MAYPVAPTAAEIARMTADQIAAMDKVCTIRTPGTPVDDGAGGETPGTPTDVLTVCRVGVPSDNDQTVADRLGVVVAAVVTLPMTETVKRTAQVLVGSRTYEVVETNAEQSSQTAMRCICTEIR